MSLARSIAAVKSLQDGAIRYKMDRNFYPGQEFDHWGGKTGSQVLAACLYGYVDFDNIQPYHKADLDDPDPTGKYAPYNEGCLNTLNGRKNVLSDRFPPGRDKAIVYYPAHREYAKPSVHNYHYADNAAHTPGRTQAHFHAPDKQGGIADSRYGSRVLTTPHKPGQFILIAPGADREYFTIDDITNFR